MIHQNHVYAGKRLDERLLRKGEDAILQKYLKESKLMSSLNHPNITRFIGLCIVPGNQLPLLVMERLHTDLAKFLEGDTQSLFRKCSILEDIARGLDYLHKLPSPIIHRDLTAKNVLLTSTLVAKIADMGNARIIDASQMATTLTKTPGTLVYMPPEALDDGPLYGPSLDIFSFGHLALFTIIQVRLKLNS